MPSTKELIQKYQEFDDLELMDVYQNIEEYSPEAKKALITVIEKKGGFDQVQLRISSIQEKEIEVAKIRNEIKVLFDENADPSEINIKITPTLLTNEEKESLIARTISELQLEKADIKIKPRTIVGSIVGGALGGTIGGVLWGLQLIYSGHMILILAFGLILLAYTFIQLFTRQSKKNKVVLIMTVISTLYALFLGQVLFESIGYLGS